MAAAQDAQGLTLSPEQIAGYGNIDPLIRFAAQHPYFSGINMNTGKDDGVFVYYNSPDYFKEKDNKMCIEQMRNEFTIALVRHGIIENAHSSWEKRVFSPFFGEFMVSGHARYIRVDYSYMDLYVWMDKLFHYFKQSTLEKTTLAAMRVENSQLVIFYTEGCTSECVVQVEKAVRDMGADLKAFDYQDIGNVMVGF